MPSSLPSPSVSQGGGGEGSSGKGGSGGGGEDGGRKGGGGEATGAPSSPVGEREGAKPAIGGARREAQIVVTFSRDRLFQETYTQPIRNPNWDIFGISHISHFG